MSYDNRWSDGPDFPCIQCGCDAEGRNKGEDGLCANCTWGPLPVPENLEAELVFAERGKRIHQTLRNNWRHEGKDKFAQWADERLQAYQREIVALQARIAMRDASRTYRT